MEREMVIGLLSVFLGALGAFMVSRFGCRLGLIDRPNLRSSHSRATPKGAGVGLLMAFVLVGIPSGFPSPIWLPAALLSLVSLLGDRFEISPKVRLVMQFAATGWACHWLFVRSGLISNRSRLEITCWLLFAALYLMGTANIYNFMDGINGIAGITGIVAFGILAGVGWARGERPEWILVALAIAAACGGFLPWNFPRSRVFMGDVGSVLLGFMFAVFAVCWSQNPADFLMFAAFLFPFYADELVTLGTRIRSGDSLTKPHRRHIYQILANQMRLPHWRVSVIYGVLQLSVATAAVVIRPAGWMAEVALLGTLFAAFWVLASWVQRHE